MTLFADKAAIVTEMRTERLQSAAQSYWPGVTLGDDYIYTKVLSAEADLEHSLRAFFEPVEVLPEGTPQSEKDALDAANKRWVDEAAYDYEPDLFHGDRWGFIPLRHAPVVSVTSAGFVYPGIDQTLYSFPVAWLRIDKKPGHLRIVPTGTITTLPLNAYIMQALGGRRTVPHLIRIRYTAGLANATRDYPDLIDLIKKVATLKIIQDQYVGQSESLSIDGISQSMSVDIPKFKENIDVIKDALHDQIHGIRVAFL